MVSVFRLSFTLPPPSPFPMSSFSLIPSFLLSLHRGIKLSAQVYKHRYPLCSTFLSALLSLPSFNNLPSSITHFHLSPPLTAFQRRQEYLSAIGQRVQPFGLKRICVFCLRRLLLLSFRLRSLKSKSQTNNGNGVICCAKRLHAAS